VPAIIKLRALEPQGQEVLPPHSGARYSPARSTRGEFEERLKAPRCCSETSGPGRQIILFIADLHTIVWQPAPKEKKLGEGHPRRWTAVTAEAGAGLASCTASCAPP